MAKAVPTLDRLPLVDKETGDLAVVLETPKGSRNKYRYDAKCQAMLWPLRGTPLGSS